VAVDYAAIVIGSGFGATVAVSELAAKGKKVLILERGTWWVTPEHLGVPTPGTPLPQWADSQDPKQPVQYWARPDHPDGLVDLFGCVRHEGNQDGLYDYRSFDNCDILAASGVGGGSLIYSNATLQPPADVLQHIGLNLTDADYQAARQWSETNRGPLNKVVTKIPLPASKNVMSLGAEDYLLLDKVRVHRAATAAVSAKRNLNPPADWQPLDLAIAEYHESGTGNDDVNKRHTFCERQGRCILGCLPQARHTLNKTLYKNWVSDPTKGVELRPRSEVRYLRKTEAGYEVVYRDYWQSDGDEKTVSAPTLFLGAGTLGTNEILLRSREKGLALSDKLGQHFSTNGNFAGFCLDTKDTVQSTRGPINTCHGDFQLDSGRIVIEDCTIPSMIAPFVATAVGIVADLEGKGGVFKWIDKEKFKLELHLAWLHKTLPRLDHFLPHLPDSYDPADARAEAEYVSNLFFFNCMGQDEANGTFALDDDELDLKWDKPPGEQKVFADIEGLLQDYSEAMGGTYVPMPLWTGFGDQKLTITHPLGGCRVAGSRTEGVVNEVGQVFDGAGDEEAAVHENLFILDASTLPGALVAHPTMTIMAQALKTMNAALA
jgi:cholesterol oxidase